MDASGPAPAAVRPLREALERAEALAHEYNAPDLAHRARDAREPLERGEIWIVVVGQFKRGKSTLVNALLGQAVLPTGIVPVTSVVTHLRWAADPGIRVTLKDGGGAHGARSGGARRGEPIPGQRRPGSGSVGPTLPGRGRGVRRLVGGERELDLILVRTGKDEDRVPVLQENLA